MCNIYSFFSALLWPSVPPCCAIVTSYVHAGSLSVHQVQYVPKVVRGDLQHTTQPTHMLTAIAITHVHWLQYGIFLCSTTQHIMRIALLIEHVVTWGAMCDVLTRIKDEMRGHIMRSCSMSFWATQRTWTWALCVLHISSSTEGTRTRAWIHLQYTIMSEGFDNIWGGNEKRGAGAVDVKRSDWSKVLTLFASDGGHGLEGASIWQYAYDNK